jgi:outer membrane protein
MKSIAALVAAGVLCVSLVHPENAGPTRDGGPAVQEPAPDMSPDGAARQGEQPVVPVVTLQQSIDAALSRGDDVRILTGGLTVAAEQHEQNLSRNSLTLSGNAGYGYTSDVIGDKTSADYKAFGSSLSSATPTGATAGVSVGGPLTSAAVSTYTNLPPSPGLDAGSVIGISLSQVLWNGYPGGPAQATVDKSVLSLNGRQIAAAASRLSLVYRVKQAYYTMLGAQRTLAVKQQILEKQKSFLAQMQAIYDLKQASRADLQTARINHQSASIDVKSGEHDVRLSRIRLAILMGAPADAQFTVAEADDPQVPDPTLEEAVKDGISRRVEIKQLQISRRSNAIDLELARGLATPTVSVTGGVNWILDWNGFKGTGIVSAGAKIALPILDGGLARHMENEKRAQDDVYATQEGQLRKSIAADIQDAYESVGISRERLELARLTAENTELLLELTRTQRDFGTATNQDFLSAAVNAANAATALAAARSSVQLAVLSLQNVMGY